MEEKNIQLLKETNQIKLLEKINSVKDENLLGKLNNQINQLEKTYPGGIKEYVNRAKVLLENSKNNVNPYSDYKPSIPQGVNMEIGSSDFHKFEQIGVENLNKIGFVLVAGGLGERLGYPGIKISIPIDLLTKKVYIEYYINYLLAYQERVKKNTGKEVNIPLCIMTSDDTNQATEKILKENNNFGLKDITIVKQEKVPALINNNCEMSFNPETLEIDTKPHGHGDVHTLLYQNKVVEKWVNNGKKYILFFQDTNALTFKSLPSFLGVSVSEQFIVNTLTIPRRPGDAMGSICSLTSKEKTITLNVEYNQLDSLLKEKYNPLGDVANEKGFSDFPGNTNVLIFETSSYLENLNITKGNVPEFVNPKYADSTKTVFKSATRLECMMQDYPLLLSKNEKVGFTAFPNWFSFAACKNNLEDSLVRFDKGLSPESAFSVEQNIFNYHAKILSLLGKIKITDSNTEKIKILNKKEVEFGPKIVFAPGFAITMKEIDEKIKGTISISSQSSLVLYENALIQNDVVVDGALIAKEEVKEKEYLKKDYINYRALAENEGELFEKIRGYKLA